MKYELASTEIFDKWFSKLKDHQAKIRIAARLKNIQKGNFGDHEGVGGGVSELRIFVGKGYRVYYAIVGDTIVLLLNGGHEGTQSKDIEKAKELAKDIEAYL